MKDLTAAEEIERLAGAEIRRELKGAATDVKSLLAGTTAQARQLLRKILDGKKLDAEPIERDGRRGYRLSGELCVGRLLPTDIFRALESSITSKTVVAPTGYARRTVNLLVVAFEAWRRSRGVDASAVTQGKETRKGGPR